MRRLSVGFLRVLDSKACLCYPNKHVFESQTCMGSIWKDYFPKPTLQMQFFEFHKEVVSNRDILNRNTPHNFPT